MSSKFNTPQNDGIKLVYARAREEGQKDVTIAYRYDDENKLIKYAKAERSKKDQYNKSIGRAVAAGRLNDGVTASTIPYSAFGDNPSYRAVASAFIGGAY